jgi:curved DNA-binding protein CbpA
MGPADYYRLLNVSKSATIPQIKAAYRKLALQYHPDTSTIDKKAAETVFKNLSVAYQVLSNQNSKEEYDLAIGNAPGSARRTVPRRAGIRSPPRGTGWQVTRDQYDVDTWYAYHYAEDAEKQPQNPFETQSSGTEPRNKHQNYYRKKNAREWRESTSGEKWHVDQAYEQYKSRTGAAGFAYGDASRQKHSGRTDAKARNKTDREHEAVDAVERRRKAAADSLNQSRMERREKAQAASPAKDDATCCVS